MMHEEETLLLEPERTRTARGEPFQVAVRDLGAAIPDEFWDSRDRVGSHFWEAGICAGTWNSGKRRCRPCILAWRWITFSHRCAGCGRPARPGS